MSAEHTYCSLKRCLVVLAVCGTPAQTCERFDDGYLYNSIGTTDPVPLPP